jgi:ABC-type Fe3+/spermidine/putrescine transport system ATPase subunit
MADMMIEFQNVTKHFGDHVANDQLSLSVRRGELMTLLGPSGCGKTTALRCLTGHMHPDAGRILIDGQDVTDIPTHRRNLGMVFQSFALFPHLSVAENIEFPLMIRHMSKDERAKRVRAMMELVRLVGTESHFPRQLSGGQQQRVGLARALVYQPQVLLLDEPLSNLDAKLREEMRFEIREVQKRLGITAIYVTHDQEEALALSDRVAIMNQGRIQQVGTPEEIYEHPQSKFVADFIGLSAFIRARVVKVEGGVAEIMAGHATLKAPALDNLAPNQSLLLFIRPDDLEFATDPLGQNTLAGVVSKATYLGNRMDYRVQINDGAEVRVQADDAHRYNPGDQVCLHLPFGCCRLIAEE